MHSCTVQSPLCSFRAVKHHAADVLVFEFCVQVLAGVQLVFSRVIPLEANPRTHPLWQLAEQFGATCGEQCTDTTTHVVATHGGTEKVGNSAVWGLVAWVAHLFYMC